MNTNKAVIIANGSYPTHEFPLSLIANANYIVCCDGAANDFINIGGNPDAIVGDCDSISEENRNRFAGIIHPDSDQQSNDLTKAINFCVQKGRTDIVIVGATGKREDHTLGNISLLADYQFIADVKMITDYGVFIPIHSTTEFESFTGQQVSLFCIDSRPVTLNGLKFPLNNYVMTNWWQGTLNEALGDKFKIETDGRVIVFREFGLCRFNDSCFNQ